MARVWSTLLVLLVACLVAVSEVSAQEKKGKKERPTPEQRFDEMERAVKHEPLTGVLTKEEFVRALKEVKSPIADPGGQLFKRIKKADPNKITKEEYVRAMQEIFAGFGRKKR